MNSKRDFCQYISRLWHEEMNSRRNEDYEENPEQMNKLRTIVDCFLDLSADLDGEIEPIRLIPKEVHGGITATFTLVYLDGDSVKHFCEALSACSAITMEATDRGVCISCTIADVFRPRSMPQYS